MNGTTGEQRRPGVSGVDRDGREQQVHRYQGGPYTISDVVHLFDPGRLEESGGGTETVLVLTAEEVRTPRTMADAYSFDYEEGFMEMCLEMAPFADQLVGGQGGGEALYGQFLKPPGGVPLGIGYAGGAAATPGNPAAAAPDYSPGWGQDQMPCRRPGVSNLENSN